MILYHDLLLRVFDQLDTHSLASCALVDKAFNAAASKALYSTVVISPTFKRAFSLRDKGNLQHPSQFLTASTDAYSTLVNSVEISGYLSQRGPPLNTLPVQIHEGISSFHNLRSLKLCPESYHQDLFSQVLHDLPQKSTVQSLTVNRSCTDTPDKVSSICRMHDLHKLVLMSPTRVLLDSLVDWLDSLQNSLSTLFLTNDCGSITPGVLRSFVPHLSNITSIALGLSYSLTNEDVFAFLADLPLLNTVDLQYYLQLRRPSSEPNLPNLRALTIRTPHLPSTVTETNLLCKHITSLIRHAPLLAALRLLPVASYLPDAAPAFDNLVSHLCAKHSGALKTLEMPGAYVGVRAVRELLGRCEKLEVLTVAVRRESVSALASLPKLHTLDLSVKHCRRFEAEEKEVLEMMRFGRSKLRRLQFDDDEDGVVWEGDWAVKDDDVSFEVKSRPVVASSVV